MPYKLVILSTAVAAASASASRIHDIESRTPLNLIQIADMINSNHMTSTFTAKVIPRFENATITMAKRLMGALLPNDPDYYMPSLERHFPKDTHFDFLGNKVSASSPLPKSFDARKDFADCKDVIGHVRDQSNCGSCWYIFAILC
jgi:hypothetical protein